MTLGFIGFGEASYYLSKNLNKNGVRLYAYDSALDCSDKRAEMVAQRAAENGIQLESTLQKLIDAADIIFNLTSAASAVPIAKTIAPLLKPHHFYVDLNSTSPKTKEEIFEIVNPSTFIEGAIMGAVPVSQSQVPIYICGEGCEEIASKLNDIGLNVIPKGVKIGAASATKMLKTVLSKGMAALITETVFCCDKYNITDEVLHSLIDAINKMSFDGYCDFVVTQAAVHNNRLSEEMSEAVKTVEAINENAIISKAVQKKFEWLTEEDYAAYFTERPKTYEEVLKVKRQKGL